MARGTAPCGPVRIIVDASVLFTCIARSHNLRNMKTADVQEEYDVVVETYCQVVGTQMELQTLLANGNPASGQQESVSAAVQRYETGIRRLFEQTMTLKQKVHGEQAEMDKSLDGFEKLCRQFSSLMSQLHENRERSMHLLAPAR